jgi:uncharacterized protein with HEPN domain
VSAQPVQQLFAASLLKSVVEAGEGVLTLAEGLQDDELRRSRLTRQTLLRLLQEMAAALTAVPPEARAAMPEIDWPGWLALPQAIGHADANQAHDGLVFGVHSLVPATLMWFRVYQPQHPQWFDTSQAA